MSSRFDLARESDTELMSRVQTSDVDAFAVLFDRHRAEAYRVAFSVCRDSGRAEDALQEGFLSVWRSRSTYRATGGTFAAWAMTSVRNRSIDSNRCEAAIRRPRASALDEQRVAAGGASIQDEVVMQNDNDELRSALLHIPDAQAEVIKLAYFGGFSQSEIAERLELPRGTVKGRARLGLEKLRQRLEARRRP